MINEKEQIKLNVSAHSDLIKRMKMLFMKGEKAASPKIPPRMATAFRPIWTTVKKTPGVLVILKHVKLFYRLHRP